MFNIFGNSGKKELEGFISRLSMDKVKENSEVLAHTYIYLGDMIKERPVIEKILKTESPSEYRGEISKLVTETNNLLNQRIKEGKKIESAAVSLINHTLRALRDENLYKLGSEMWTYFQDLEDKARKHLDELADHSKKAGFRGRLEKIEKARDFVGLIPKKFQ
jgi:hypothetical protein